MWFACVGQTALFFVSARTNKRHHHLRGAESFVRFRGQFSHSRQGVKSYRTHTHLADMFLNMYTFMHSGQIALYRVFEHLHHPRRRPWCLHEMLLDPDLLTGATISRTCKNWNVAGILHRNFAAAVWFVSTAPSKGFFVKGPLAASLHCRRAAQRGTEGDASRLVGSPHCP